MKEEKLQNGRIITVRLLPEEAEILDEKAKEAHMSKARFLKNVILQGGAYKKTNFTKVSRDKLIYELDHIANNLNQITYFAHVSENIDEIEFLRLRDYYLELLSTFYDFIKADEKKSIY